MANSFTDKVVVITGHAAGIGLCLAKNFAQAGASVAGIDLNENDYFVGDIADRATLERFAQKVIDEFGHVDILINNALPPMRGIEECSYDEFLYSLKVGTAAPFYLAKLLSPHMPQGSSIINIASTRSRQSQPYTESYSAAKGGIEALTHALAVSLGPKIRVNCIAPGWIHTHGEEPSATDHAQHPAGRVGRPEDIASLTMFLSSDEAAFITGETIVADGGMSRLMIYHNDHGWAKSQE